VVVECGKYNTIELAENVLTMISCICKVWFTPTTKPRLSLHDFVSAIFAHPDSLAAEDGITDYRRAAKRAKITDAVEDIGNFRHVRLSRNSQNNAAAQDVGVEISEQDSTDGLHHSMSKDFDKLTWK
jgi:hypothetical protein